MDTKRLLAAVLLAASVSAVHATGNDEASRLTTCLDLGPDRDVARTGNNSSFVLRDGDRHYLVSLRGTCNSMASARSVSIRAGGVDNRLCPKGTTVQTRYDICSVKQVEQIEPAHTAAR